jgi:hypothetical protein
MEFAAPGLPGRNAVFMTADDSFEIEGGIQSWQLHRDDGSFE